MDGITSRTIILLGGNSLLDATTDLTAESILAVGSVVVSPPEQGAADLTSGSDMVAFAGQGHQASATLDFGSIAAGVGTSIRLASADLASDVDMVSSGQSTLNAASSMDTEAVLTGAGGFVTDGAADMSTAVNITLIQPGALVAATAPGFTSTVALSTTASPVFRLILPTGSAAFTTDRLWRWFPIKTGITLLVNDGVVTLKENVSDTELKAADAYYLGGYRHQINAAERAVIVSAGYGDLIEEA